jgi:Short C-terminal domain
MFRLTYSFAGHIAVITFAGTLGMANLAGAAEKAQGFIVLTQGAPVYRMWSGDQLLGKADKGEPVAGFNFTDYALRKGQAGGWYGKLKDGRVQVKVLILDGKRNKTPDGWMNPNDLSQFSYECGCGPSNSDDPCSPFVYQSTGWNSIANWNMCFEDAKNEKLAKMAAVSAPPAVQPTAVAPTESVEERLKKLDELKTKGLITQQEYDAKRAEILKNL